MKYSHAMTLAFEVVSSDPTMPSRDEVLGGLMARLADLLRDPSEVDEALLGELPFDTHEIDESEARS